MSGYSDPIPDDIPPCRVCGGVRSHELDCSARARVLLVRIMESLDDWYMNGSGRNSPIAARVDQILKDGGVSR